MEVGHKQRMLPGFELLLGLVTVTAIVLAIAGQASLPRLSSLVIFAALLILAEHAAVLLPSSAGVSPSFMLVMTAVVALAGREMNGPGVLVGAGIVGACGGLELGLIRARRYRVIYFNVCQFSLSAMAAAAAYLAVGRGDGGWIFVAALAASVTYPIVNAGLVIAWVSLTYGHRPQDVWADCRAVLVNFLAFGILGVLLGRLYLELGPLALVLLFVPVAVARMAFSGYLQLKQSHDAAVRVLWKAIEAKDPYTAGHTERVAKYSAYIGAELGLSPARMEHLRYAALMHDIGKLAVPSRLLNKPGRLTEDEFALVRRHNDVCVDILARVDFLKSTLPTASDRHGHYADSAEHLDPSVVEAYIVAVADAFDAMTSTRSYRRALTQDVALSELRDKAGSQFHPGCVEALGRSLDRRGERYGLGFETDIAEFAVAPPVAGVGSAGLGDLLPEPEVARS